MYHGVGEIVKILNVFLKFTKSKEYVWPIYLTREEQTRHTPKNMDGS